MIASGRPTAMPPPLPSPGGGPGGQGVAAALAPVTLAAQGVKGALESIVHTARGFVEALSPSVVANLGRAFYDLHATVGVALQPVIEATTSLVKTFGSVLLPVMNAL